MGHYLFELCLWNAQNILFRKKCVLYNETVKTYAVYCHIFLKKIFFPMLEEVAENNTTQKECIPKNKYCIYHNYKQSKDVSKLLKPFFIKIEVDFIESEI